MGANIPRFVPLSALLDPLKHGSVNCYSVDPFGILFFFFFFFTARSKPKSFPPVGENCGAAMHSDIDLCTLPRPHSNNAKKFNSFERKKKLTLVHVVF